MKDFANFLQKLNTQQVQLVAVSKTQPLEKVKAIYDQGQRVFAENRVQELVVRYENLPKDISWHIIGHLQRNKVKKIASFIQLIHSVDSLDLLQTIDSEAIKHDRVIDCLLQFFIAKEETKYGLDEAEAVAILNSPEFKELKNVRICGVMSMATNTEKEEQIREEFRCLRAIYFSLKKQFFQNDEHFKEISMGMSNDYMVAVDEGSTMVRLGSLLFE
jgi:PLP dependent protein